MNYKKQTYKNIPIVVIKTDSKPPLLGLDWCNIIPFNWEEILGKIKHNSDKDWNNMNALASSNYKIDSFK